MWHDLIERALPFTGRTWTWTRVRAVLARLLVLVLFLVLQALVAPAVDVLAGKEDGVGHFLHAQVAYVAERTATRGTTGQLGSTVGADDVARLTLKYRRQGVVEAHRTLEETDEILQRVDHQTRLTTHLISARICRPHQTGRRRRVDQSRVVEQVKLMLKAHVVVVGMQQLVFDVELELRLDLNLLLIRRGNDHIRSRRSSRGRHCRGPISGAARRIIRRRSLLIEVHLLQLGQVELVGIVIIIIIRVVGIIVVASIVVYHGLYHVMLLLLLLLLLHGRRRR